MPRARQPRFRAEGWAPDTGWPISRADIEPYLPEVHEILELPDFRPDVPVSDDIRWVQLIKSPAVRFGEKFADELDTRTNVAVVLNTYATELAGDGKRVTGAKLWSNGKDAGSFTADYFVVCTGGLENSRLLLWSNQRSNGGVVPNAAALGRYWMEHPTFEGGNAILADYSEFEVDATNEAFFSPTLAAMERLEIMDFGIRLIETPYPGIKSIIADLACTAPEMANGYPISSARTCAAPPSSMSPGNRHRWPRTGSYCRKPMSTTPACHASNCTGRSRTWSAARS